MEKSPFCLFSLLNQGVQSARSLKHRKQSTATYAMLALSFIFGGVVFYCFWFQKCVPIFDHHCVYLNTCIGTLFQQQLFLFPDFDLHFSCLSRPSELCAFFRSHNGNYVASFAASNIKIAFESFLNWYFKCCAWKCWCHFFAAWPQMWLTVRLFVQYITDDVAIEFAEKVWSTFWRT